MNTELFICLLGLLGLVIIGFVIKSIEKESEKAKKENREVKESSCANFGCIVGGILVAIFIVFLNFKDCSNSSNISDEEDIHLTEPIHPW